MLSKQLPTAMKEKREDEAANGEWYRAELQVICVRLTKDLDRFRAWLVLTGQS